MVLAQNTRIVIKDYDLPAGSEHNLIQVQQLANGIWITQLEFDGLATTSSGFVSPIGSTITGHKIKAYITAGKQEGAFSLNNLSQISGVGLDEKIFNPIEKDKNDNPVLRKKYGSTDYFTTGVDPTSTVVLYQGNRSQILDFVSGMLRAGNAINDADYSYEFPSITNIFYHTQNSNRTAFTLIEAGLRAAKTTPAYRTEKLDLITRWDAPGSGKSFNLDDAVWQGIDSIGTTTTTPNSFAPLHDNPFLYFTSQELLKLTTNGTPTYTPYKTVVSEGETINIFQKTANIIIDGATFTASVIAEASEVAYNTLEQFAKNTVSPTVLTSSLNTALNATFTYIGANYNNLSTTNILKTFATAYGIANISTSITQTDLVKQIGHAINGTQLKASNDNLPQSCHNNTVKNVA